MMKGVVLLKDSIKKNTMLVALISVMILFQILIVSADRGSLFAPANISNIISQNSYVVILATGMLLCILTGGNIDLSIGSIVALVGAIAGTLVVRLEVNVYVSIAICLFIGCLIGAWHGFWIAYVNIPAFITTLAGMLLWRGVSLIILDGLVISPFPNEYLRFFTSYLPNTKDKSFIFIFTIILGICCCSVFIIFQILKRRKKIKKGYEVCSPLLFIIKVGIFASATLLLFLLLGNHKGIPVVLVLIAVVVLVYIYFTQKTVYGRYFYALGGNEKATRLSGINTKKILFSAYINMGFLSALAALVTVARFNSAAPTAGMNYELDAIGACFIGGASAYGGTGTVGGAVIGAIFMGVLNNGMSILGVDANWQRVVKGLVLLLAVVFDVMSKRRSKDR